MKTIIKRIALLFPLTVFFALCAFAEEPVFPVKVIVGVPETAPVGSIYYGEVLFKTLSSSSESSEGMISFTTGYSKSFEIEVIPNPNVITSESVTETDVTEETSIVEQTKADFPL